MYRIFDSIPEHIRREVAALPYACQLSKTFQQQPRTGEGLGNCPLGECFARMAKEAGLPYTTRLQNPEATECAVFLYVYHHRRENPLLVEAILEDVPMSYEDGKLGCFDKTREFQDLMAWSMSFYDAWDANQVTDLAEAMGV